MRRTALLFGSLALLVGAASTHACDPTIMHRQMPLLLGLRWDGAASQHNHAAPFMFVAGLIGDRMWSAQSVTHSQTTGEVVSRETSSIHRPATGCDVRAGLLFNNTRRGVLIGYRGMPNTRTIDPMLRRWAVAGASGHLPGVSTQYVGTTLVWGREGPRLPTVTWRVL